MAKDCHHRRAGARRGPRRELPGEEIRYSELLISDLNWVTFDVAMGRILATGTAPSRIDSVAHRELPDGSRRVVAVTLDRGLVSLHYEYHSATRQLVIRVIRRDRVEIELTSAVMHRRRGATMAFVQQPAGDVSLTLQSDGDAPRQYQAASLWHLQLAQPRSYVADS